MRCFKYFIITFILLITLNGLVVAETPVMNQGGLPGTSVSIVDRPESNPLLPTNKTAEPGGWLSQVTEIRQKYHLRRKNILQIYESRFEQLNAYDLLRLDRYQTKPEFMDGFRKAEQAYAAIHGYRKSSDLNDQHFVQAFDHISADPATRKKLIQVLTKNMNSPKEASQKRLILLEEKMFSELLRLYRLLASNATKWDIRSGAFIFKNDLLKARYKSTEQRLNNTIRQLQTQRDLEKETG